MVETDAVLQVADGVFDLGVAAMVGLQIQWRGGLVLASVSSLRGGPTSLNAQGGRLDDRAIKQMVKIHATAAGLVSSAVHLPTLRHSCTTHLLKGGANLSLVQQVPGHAHVTEQEARRPYLANHPMAKRSTGAQRWAAQKAAGGDLNIIRRPGGSSRPPVRIRPCSGSAGNYHSPDALASRPCWVTILWPSYPAASSAGSVKWPAGRVEPAPPAGVKEIAF